MIDAKIDTAAAERNLRRIAERVANRRPVNRQVAAALQAWVFRNFKGQGGLTESKHWTPLKPATIRDKARRGYSMILQNTGALRQSFLPFSDNDMAGVGAQQLRGKRAPWDLARIHQEGTEHIPARPMLPTMHQALPIGMQVYEHYIARAVREVS